MLFHSYAKRDQLIGVIYLQSLENVRAGGVVVRNIEIFRKTVGERAAKNVVIATTKWELATEAVAQRRHDQLSGSDKFFGTLMEEGAKFMSCRQGERQQVLDEVVRRHQEKICLLIQQEIVILEKKVRETEAGQLLEDSAKRAHKEWAEKTRLQIQQLMRDSNKWTTQEIKETKKEMKKANEDRKKELKSKQKVMSQRLKNNKSILARLGLQAANT